MNQERRRHSPDDCDTADSQNKSQKERGYKQHSKTIFSITYMVLREDTDEAHHRTALCLARGSRFGY